MSSRGFNIESWREDLQRKIGKPFKVLEKGDGFFLISTPFVWDDGDHVSLVVREVEGQWLLGDGGHTFMRCSFDERASCDDWQQVIVEFGVREKDGELYIPILNEQDSSAFLSLIRAMRKLVSLSLGK